MMHIVVLDCPPHCLDSPAWDGLAGGGRVSRYSGTTFTDLIGRAVDATVIVTTELPLRREVLDYLTRLETVAVPSGRAYGLVETTIARQLGIRVVEFDPPSQGDRRCTWIDSLGRALAAAER
ncbi:MAG: hypothetical protein MI724_03245 [Spirochaetales bacterium]|nr:hypothetical protein [Spirochaetales bacterium]